MSAFAKRKRLRIYFRFSVTSCLCFALAIEGRMNSQTSHYAGLNPELLNNACEENHLDLCESWCRNHPLPWEDKCQWTRSCGGCSECSKCKVWCEENPTPWKDNNNDAIGNVKCSWKETCAGCPECLTSQNPSNEPSEMPTPSQNPSNEPSEMPTPSPPPTKGCKPWCENHSVPWTNPRNPGGKQKCDWEINCGGCPQCINSSNYLPKEVASPLNIILSAAPSFTPSLSHTDSKRPSLTPSHAPTVSFAPTDSKRPSLTPSHAPTVSSAPTDSKNPSFAPSHAPTVSFTPTISEQPSLVRSPPTLPPVPRPPPVNGCKRWCKYHPASWKSSNPSVHQKCKWNFNCGGCPECAYP